MFFFVGDSGICAPIGHAVPSTNTPTQYEVKDRCPAD
jgi:hypothetical protein